jgi:hypothetical protein
VPDDAYGEIEAALQSVVPSKAVGRVSDRGFWPERRIAIGYSEAVSILAASAMRAW